MSQQYPWGSARQHQNARLTPISTAFTSEQRNTPSPSNSRPGFSPASNNFPSLPPPSARNVASRKSSASSTSSPFTSSYPGQQPSASQLLSSRTRTIAPQSSSQLASSAAALPTASQGGGGASSSGGGATKLARASPSLSQSSTVGSPSTTANPSNTPGSKDLSRITIAQIFLLLSQLGPVKEEKDKTKWETQAEQIRKLVDSNGMEVFTKYFRRILQTNAGHVFPSPGRSAEPNGSYPMLVSEIQKVRHDPQQATKIAEAIDTNDGGDIFRDFDLSTFLSHFKLDPVSKVILCLAFKSASRPDLRTKADAILSNNFHEFLVKVAKADLSDSDDLPPDFLAHVVDRLVSDPPRDWDDEKKTSLVYAINMRYQETNRIPVPVELQSVLYLLELLDPSRNPLVKLIYRAGPKAMATVDACAEMLATVETRDISYQQVAMVLLFMVITQGGQAYNARNFVLGLRKHRFGQRIDWQDVVRAFDQDSVRVTKNQFLSLYDALLRIATESEDFDIQLLWGGQWQHALTQLSFLVAFLSCSSEELDAAQIPRLRPAFTVEMFANASDEVRARAEEAVRHPYVSLDAIKALYTMVFESQDSYHTAQTLGITDRIINPHTDLFLVAAAGVPKPWMTLQETALKQLFAPYFKKGLRNYEFVVYGLWQQDTQWLIDRFAESFTAEPASLSLILEYAETNGWVDALIQSKHEFSLDLAAQAHARGLFEIEPWLQQTYEQTGPIFRKILFGFLSAKASEEARIVREDTPPTGLPLAVKTVHPMIWFLAGSGLPDADVVTLQRQCIQAYPRLINYGEGVDDIIDENGRNGNSLPEEADKKMQEHFKNMYSGDSDVREIITILKTYKESRDPAEQDLFACMIHGLFDEYNCFGEYPLEALATTAVLFGGIINFNLLSRIALRVGLAMVLDAVQDFRPSDSMYKFGLQALIHFSNRLPEWPHYCETLLSVPGLRGTEIWPKAEEVVGQQLTELNGEAQNGLGMANGANEDDSVHQEPRMPRFTCLHVDPPLRPDIYEEPNEDVQDKVLFVLNNVSARNIQEKVSDLMEALEDKHHQWFASYLVEERAKVQLNFQQLYLDMLDLINDNMLWAEVLRETYVAVVRLLNSDSTEHSPTERGYIKALGSWLGSLTIARDKPIKFRNISFKDLLIEAFESDRLLVVIPFTCKVLARAADSTVFKPPNPWLMEMIKILVELYHGADLKIQHRFEIELLCKDLNLDHNAIEPSSCILSRPHGDDEFLGPVIPEGMETFPHDLSLVSLNRARGQNERFSPAAITANLPDFSNQLVYPPVGSNSGVRPADLKKVFLSAAQQAIQEIIAPVVERSVTIAAISTSQLVIKDFAMEGDENKLREAAHTVVKSLSGSLALVTCKEPLRMSIINNLRVMARDLPEHALPEGHVLMFVNDNLDTVCSLVEQAAEMSSMAEIDLQIEEAVRTRRIHRNTRPNEPFKDPSISPFAFYIPEPYKPTIGGLNREQLAIYEDFGRQVRGTPHANNAQDTSRQVPDVLQEQFAAVPNLPTPAEAPAVPRQAAQQRLQIQPAHAPPAQQINGYMDAPGLERGGQRDMLELLADLFRAVKEAPEEHIAELRPSSPIRELYEQVLAAIDNAGIHKDTLAFRVAGHLTAMLFAEPLRRIEVEVAVQLLSILCQWSTVTSKHILPWFTNSEVDDRIFNAAVMTCLVDSGLIDLHKINSIVAKAIQQRREAAVEMLGTFMDEMLLNEHPSALRADFAPSIAALTSWVVEDPSFELGKQVISKLQAGLADQALTPPATDKKDQMEYIFDEWVHLQYPEAPKMSINAFFYQLHRTGILKSQQETMEFIRICIDCSVASYEREMSLSFGANPDQATLQVDALGKLIVSLIVYQGDEHAGDDSALKESKAKYLDRILLVVALVLVNHHKTRGDRFNQKVFFRLFATILFELHQAAKENVFVGAKEDVFLVIAKVFLILQPEHIPRFAFAWLTLISHRIFIPAMLEDDQEDGNAKDRRWEMYAQLMEVLLKFTGRIIKPTGETIVAQSFYRGVLRVLLVIHHDYPEFLAENHFRFCNSIPMHCTQLRNLIVSAYPSNILEMPDPFATGLKVDRLEDIRQAPHVRADIDHFLRQAGVKDALDALLKSTELKDEDVRRIAEVTYYEQPKPAGFELVPTFVNAPLVHAIALYIGSVALSQGSKGMIFDAQAPSAVLLKKLAREMRPEGQFQLISAIANQLRWPNTHTHYFSYALLHLFGTPEDDTETLAVQQTITRVLLERLLVHRPHPWGLIITLLEILKNSTYQFWELPFVKAAPEVERLFNALFSHAQQSPRPLV